MTNQSVTKDDGLVLENRIKLGWLVTNQFKMAPYCSYQSQLALIHSIKSANI